jgi:tetratricopeptide (TPR) repeat protein
MIAGFRKSKWIILFLALFIIVQSCAIKKTQAPPKRSVHKSAQAATQARQHLAAGEYQKAINNYRSAYRNRPQDQALLEDYVKDLEEIKKAADKASNENNLALAGRIYDVLLKNYSYFKDFSRMLSFDRTHLDTKLTDCKLTLSVQGFQEYRKGDLTKAIALWQSLLKFDPDNADIKRAVKTAKLQQKNLQERAASE